ncbi:MAG: hypothetical protein LUI15_03315 [Firmicutes bacterium]|nr:hypothetical protein [Bacillota bacterium]
MKQTAKVFMSIGGQCPLTRIGVCGAKAAAMHTRMKQTAKAFMPIGAQCPLTRIGV